MLHIKDIEAFARINEALANNAQADDARAEAPLADGTDNAPATGPADAGGNTAHPAMLLAMVATGRLPLSALPKPKLGASALLPWNRFTRKP